MARRQEKLPDYAADQRTRRQDVGQRRVKELRRRQRRLAQAASDLPGVQAPKAKPVDTIGGRLFGIAILFVPLLGGAVFYWVVAQRGTTAFGDLLDPGTERSEEARAERPPGF